MPRIRTLAAVLTVVVATGIGIALAIAFTPRTEAGKLSAASASGPDTAGFDQFELAGLIVKVGLAEQAGSARLVVAASLDGKPVTKGVAVTGLLSRPLGESQPLRFVPSGPAFVSFRPIDRPHVFDATLKATWQGQSASYVFSRSEGAVALNAQQVRTAGIRLANAGAGRIGRTVQLPGEIRFNEDKTAHVVPRVGGVIEQVSVSVGEKVRKGQLLAVVASTDLADRRSEWLTADRRLAAARVAYKREETLWQERISAEQDYLQAQAQLREAEIAERSARQKLTALGAPTSAAALNRYELRAPFDGTLVEKHATAGEAIAADASIFTLSDLSTVWAEMAVNAQQLDDVRVGRDATVQAAASVSRSTGRVAYIGSLLGADTRSAAARVVLANPDGAWRPGMFVNVSVDAGQVGVPVVVEKDAMQDVDGAPSVFVPTSKGFVAQPLTLGRQDERMAEVVGGLAPGQQYVASNGFLLKAELGKSSLEEE